MPSPQTPQRPTKAPRTREAAPRKKSADVADKHQGTPASPGRTPPRDVQPKDDTLDARRDDRDVDIDIDAQDPAIEGEGSYTATRRHRESVERFIQDDRVDDAARDAAPDSPDEADTLRRAEEEGRRHARK